VTRIARTEKLADAYGEAAAELDRAVLAIEAGDKARAQAAMRRVMETMDEVGELIVSGPILPRLRLH
jgi:DNA-binding GntR family transcriptional regulator